MLREKAKAQLKELNERLQGGEHYESVLDDIYDTDDETYADFNCETFSGTYLIKENRISNSISVWDINEQGEVVGYLKNETEEARTMKLYLAENTYDNSRWTQLANTEEEAEKGFMEDMKKFALGFIENEGLEEDWELYFETEEIALKVHVESLGSSLYDKLDFDEVPKMNIDEMRNLISEIEDETSSIYSGYTSVYVHDIDDVSEHQYDEIYWTEEDNIIYLLRTY